ncbi:MAG: hypothetical protein ACLQM8_07400 [Limisphaerales bacterium]
MKTIKLMLSDHVHQIALNLAKAEDVEIGHFAAVVLSDGLIELSRKRPVQEPECSPKPNRLAAQMPDTVLQIHAACDALRQGSKSLPEAISTTAYKFGVLETTVRDKCTRRIGLASMADFMKLLSQPADLVDHLCRKFPRNAAETRALFAPILPGSGLASVAPHTSQAPSPHDVSEMDLITAIVAVLKAHGGKLDKCDVEREVFDRFEGAFQHPHYKEGVGGGVERWRKNVQFARNTACNTLGLIKTPYESGRGVWELTDKGRAWVRP